MTGRHIIGGVASAALLTLFASTGANAQSFQFSTDFRGTGGVGQSVFSDSGLSAIIGTDGNDPTVNSAPTAIVLTNLTTASSSAALDPFTNRAYSIDLSVRNVNNNQIVTQTLTGGFSGSVSTTQGFFTSAGFNQSSLTFNYSNGDSILVNNFTFLSPGAPGSSTSGSIGATVQFTAFTPSAPEPGSFVLAGMGLVSMGGVAIRRKRNAAAA